MPRLESGFRRVRLNDAGKSTKKAKVSNERRYGARWAKAAKRFISNNPLCADCEGRGLVVAAKVVDHKRPHRGNDELFWDQTNWQSLCVPCHNRKSASENAGGNVRPSHRPHWMSMAKVPVTLVTGPAGSGRREYVEQRAGPRDGIIDINELRATTEDERQAIQRRNSAIGRLSGPAALQYEKVWWIDDIPKASVRAWWEKKLGCEVIILLREKSECERHLRASGREDQIEFMEEWIKTYSTNFTQTEIYVDA